MYCSQKSSVNSINNQVKLVAKEQGRCYLEHLFENKRLTSIWNITMIAAVGVDIVEIARMERVISRWGDHFLRKILTDREYAYCTLKSNMVFSVAARFAAKEAVYKSLPEHAQSTSRWHDIEVIHTDSGKPTVVCHGSLEALTAEMSWHLTLSHSNASAVAFVVLETKEEQQ